VALAGARPAARRRTLIDLVLIGSSTGGPALLSHLFARLPADFPAPVVIAQHIPATFSATLARRLDEACPLRVQEVDRVLTVRPGNVYVGRGNADVVVARRTDGLVVKPVPASDQYRWHPSVDRLVASARRICEPRRLIGVLLTGMGDDGAEELRHVHAGGGRTVAEAESTAVVWGMPGELVRRGGATAVLPSHQIATQLVDWVY
jgi:two-component system chemotaxis response regulator CheB